VKAPHREASLRVTAELIALYKRRARRLHREWWRSFWSAVWFSLLGREMV